MPSSNAQAATATTQVSAKQKNSAPAGMTAGNSSQTALMASANGNGQAAAQLSATQTTQADPTGPAPQKNTALVTTTTPVDLSPTTTTAKPAESAAEADSIAAAAAGTVVSPAAASIATPPADPKPRQSSTPQSVAAGGVGAASANQVPDAAPSSAMPADDEAPLVPDLQSMREQRANSAVASLSQADSGNANTTASQSVGSTTGLTAAAPQTALHNTTAADGSSSTSQTTDTNLSQADRVRFVQRVEQVFQDLDGQGGSVRLRLSPPELGSLHIEISVAKGEMTARVQAETPAARNILLDNLPALRERLAQRDIKVQSFDVDLMDRSTGGMSNQSSQYQNPSQQNGSGTSVRTPFRGSSELPGMAAAAPSRPVSDGGRLNVVV